MIPVDDEPYSKTIVIPSSMIGKFFELPIYKLAIKLNTHFNGFSMFALIFLFFHHTFIYLIWYCRSIILILSWWHKWVCLNTFCNKYECSIIISIPKFERYFLSKRKFMEKHIWKLCVSEQIAIVQYFPQKNHHQNW